jgi:UDP-N-acetylglucosamine 2-epimerase (non-hydrolysing)
MLKVLVVMGTRPEAVKLAPVIHVLKKAKKQFEVRVGVSAQHREMLDQVLKIFKIAPDYDLNIMRNNQSLVDLTARLMTKLHVIISREKPDIVLVQGDTTTVFIASLVAYYLKIKIGHVEAGLRTHDKYNPFPEEMNRRLTDCLSDEYFAPTTQAKNNLLSEGVSEEKIFITGNTVIDALLMIKKLQQGKTCQQKLKKSFEKKYSIDVDSKKIILVTGHRRESFGEDLKKICLGLKMIAEATKDVQIIYPVHLNPNVQKPVYEALGGSDTIHLIKPLDYFSFVWLMGKSYLILTDSGGIQEEAPALGKPVLVMRKVTERPEGIRAGTARLVGADSNAIYYETLNLLVNKQEYQNMAKAVNPYGDGHASERIRNALTLL